MKRSKTIIIPPTRIVAALIIFLVLVTTGFILVPRISNPFVEKPIGMTAETAARAGLEAFLSVDAKAGKAAWVEKVCQVSTPQGCKMVSQAYAAMVWPVVEKKSLRLDCKSASASLLTTLQKPLESEIWELKTVCTNIDTGEADNSTTQVIVSKSAESGWKFERIRFDQETKK
jgi:hypothetical protein